MEVRARHDGFCDSLAMNITSVRDYGPAHKLSTLSSCTDDLHSREILQIIHTRDYLIAWSASLYSIEPRSQVYGSFFGGFPKSHGDTIDDKHRFSSPDDRSVKKDHPDVRRHATGIYLGS